MKVLRNIPITLIVMVVMVFSLWGDEPDVKFSMDFARYRSDSSSVLLEVYYSVIPNEKMADTNEEINADLNFELVSQETDSILVRKDLDVSINPAKVAKGTSGSLGIIKFNVPLGKYLLRMYNQTDTISYETSIGSFYRDFVTISDIELASNVITNSKQSEHPFYKNTMQVQPNPSGIYGKGSPRLYYYLELYNLNIGNVTSQDSVWIQAVISDTKGHVRMRKDYSRTRQYESCVELGAFNVHNLETGLYTLIFAVSDSLKDKAVYRRENFYVHNPDVVLAEKGTPTETYVNSEFNNLPEAKLDEMFEQAKYLAEKSEVEVYELFNDAESKRKFMFRFWKTRNDQKPGWKQEYYDRVDYANETFGTRSKEGWETDKGRVYILYGPPDEYDRHPGSMGENPYVIWRYYKLEGGVEFDFVDYTGFGTYDLVNSTKRGEVHYPNWRQDYVSPR